MDKEERKEYNKKYYLEHKDEKKECCKKYYLENKEEINARGKKRRLEHKEEIKEYNKKYRLGHKDQIKKYVIEHKDEAKRYSLQHKDRIMERLRKRRKIQYNNDPIYKRLQSIRARFRGIITKIIKHGDISVGSDADCLKLFGTTVNGFKKHIESQFTDTMNWYNHGRMENTTKWQLDHIIPLGSFDFNIEENFTKAFHYTNTQPLMSSDHIEKSSKEKGTT